MDASSILHRIEPLDEARELRGPSRWHPIQCDQCGQPDPRNVKAIAAEYAQIYRTWSLIRCADRAYIAAVKGAKPKCVAALSADHRR